MRARWLGTKDCKHFVKPGVQDTSPLQMSFRLQQWPAHSNVPLAPDPTPDASCWHAMLRATLQAGVLKTNNLWWGLLAFVDVLKLGARSLVVGSGCLTRQTSPFPSSLRSLPTLQPRPGLSSSGVRSPSVPVGARLLRRSGELRLMCQAGCTRHDSSSEGPVWIRTVTWRGAVLVERPSAARRPRHPLPHFQATAAWRLLEAALATSRAASRLPTGVCLGRRRASRRDQSGASQRSGSPSRDGPGRIRLRSRKTLSFLTRRIRIKRRTGTDKTGLGETSALGAGDEVGTLGRDRVRVEALERTLPFLTRLAVHAAPPCPGAHFEAEGAWRLISRFGNPGDPESHAAVAASRCLPCRPIEVVNGCDIHHGRQPLGGLQNRRQVTEPRPAAVAARSTRRAHDADVHQLKASQRLGWFLETHGGRSPLGRPMYSRSVCRAERKAAASFYSCHGFTPWGLPQLLWRKDLDLYLWPAVLEERISAL
ncbi:hypothetical protein KFL_002240175 [Klebsormidium nitens]|uniref:Uncharacterized protein n=1 Tax=Klebsormidium nitens TaxID=105231 RepID=A0A1Y1I951_KLENI|nr:hypothetical protein KFL_002240175 [Klebsormidium nitens]|eukprot:GAQ85216.1 hypothetical protein KFL_002240175 [Klebsormidium nitens]